MVVGPETGGGTAFDATLSRLATLSPGPRDAPAVREALRSLVVPPALETADVAQLAATLAPFLADHPQLVATEGSAAGTWEGSNAYTIETLLGTLLHDPHARQRAARASRADGGREADSAHPLPPFEPPVATPGDLARALTPYLDHWEARVRANRTAHLPLSVAIARGGTRAGRSLWRDWIEVIEARGLGLAGTNAAIARAVALHDMPWDWETFSWARDAAPLVPLLDDPHPLVACAAAARLGGFYFVGEVEEDAASPPFRAMLERFRDPSRGTRGAGEWPRSVAGAFAGGFEFEYASTLPAAMREAGVEPADWFLDVLALPHGPDDDAHLPETVALWFVIHEAFAADPGTVMRLVEAAHHRIALMTATELQARVPGMEAPLARLAREAPPPIARAAADWLARFYGASG